MRTWSDLIRDPRSDDPAFEDLLGRPTGELFEACRAIEVVRAHEGSLYTRVRACAWMGAICRFALQDAIDLPHGACVPAAAWRARLDRRFAEAAAELWQAMAARGPGRMLLSELGAVYQAWTFAELARQVQHAVRSSRGNRWLFRCGSLWEYPLRLRRVLKEADAGLYPVLVEETPVRLDLTHSGWSDIFFLAMERPDLARVINASVALAVGRPGQAPTGEPQPPITCRLRVIDEPVLRLTAVDLGETRDLLRLDEVFDFASDHLGLIKAALVASGVVPPAVEGTAQELTHLLRVLVGPGLGLEVASHVRDLPKGSRLAVSTNLLASLVSLLMRATGQTRRLEGALEEDERRIVASRAILGEWLGGSGGGWQDSGGIWPGFKVIEGVEAAPGDLEHGVSRGCLLPRHRLLTLAPAVQQRVFDSMVVFHGGMAGNVGPILEQVTDQHLLGRQAARMARIHLRRDADAIEAALVAGDVRRLGTLTQQQFDRELPAIIPAVDNAFTSACIAEARRLAGDGFHGFGMMGGMSGGGMAMWVDPARRPQIEERWPAILAGLADRFRSSLPFAITPVAIRIGLDDQGTRASLRRGRAAGMDAAYYRVHAPVLARCRHDDLSPRRRLDLLNHVDHDLGEGPASLDILRRMVVHLLPDPVHAQVGDDGRLAQVKTAYGFDRERQERLQHDLRAGLISAARNRLPASLAITDVPDALVRRPQTTGAAWARAQALLEAGAVAEVVLAGGVGTRWSGGAGVVKALSPFVKLGGAWRSFLELHVRKAAQAARRWKVAPPLLVTTSFLTDQPVRAWLAAMQATEPDLVAGVTISPGRGVCQRVVPTPHDLHDWLAELPRPKLDPQAEKARQARDRAWIHWAESTGPGSPYTDNAPDQVLNPPGHAWELFSALINGSLHRLLIQRPQIQALFLHNCDTLGASLDPACLAAHLEGDAVMTCEVIARLAGDAGGSLALVEGRPRLIEGLAIPDEAMELGLRYYNSNSWWISVDRLLGLFGLGRSDLGDAGRVAEAVRHLAGRLPTYVTLKQVKRRWGRGQEDLYPVAQFEQLWGDLSTLDACPCTWLLVDRQRGQQLKDASQLSSWHLDGSRDLVARLAGVDGG